MPLTPQDQLYWKEKLGWKNYLRVLSLTAIIGCVVWPIFRYIMVWSAGNASQWNSSAAFSEVVANFFLAVLVSTLIWCLGQVFSFLDWLPPRR